MLEGLENRRLLSGGPTVYTVNSTGNASSGSGYSGTLPYVIDQANANSNIAGSGIKFDPTVFRSSQTITLGSTLVLSETAGPEVIAGPGASLAAISGNNAVEVFSVASGVTATVTGLTISGGLASRGGGLSVDGGTVSLTDVTVLKNQAVGVVGSDGSEAESVNDGAGGAGGCGLGGAVYLAGGSLTLSGDTLTGNVARGGAGGADRSRDRSGRTGGAGGTAAGGAVYVAAGNLVLKNDSFQSNQAIGGAGRKGRHRRPGRESLRRQRPNRRRRWSRRRGGAAAGGAIYLAQGYLSLATTTLTDNLARGGAGGNGGLGGAARLA